MVDDFLQFDGYGLSNQAGEGAETPVGTQLLFGVTPTEQLKGNEKLAALANSDLIWALYIASSQAKVEPIIAWNLLARANYIEKNKRDLKFSRQQAEQQTKHITTIFHKEFWRGFPSAAEGKGSKLPIFIVGMMR